MTNIDTSEKVTSISRFHKLLSSIHKELFQNRQIISQSDQEKTSFSLKQCVQQDIQRTKKKNHKSISVIILFSRVEDISEIRFI